MSADLLVGLEEPARTLMVVVWSHRHTTAWVDEGLYAAGQALGTPVHLDRPTIDALTDALDGASRAYSNLDDPHIAYAEAHDVSECTVQGGCRHDCADWAEDRWVAARDELRRVVGSIYVEVAA